MGWETRGTGSHRYFYLPRRVGNRVVRQYFGRGPDAQQAAQADAAARALRMEARSELLALRATLDGLDRLTAELRRGSDLLSEAALLSSGFHQHRGQWRKWRGTRMTVESREHDTTMEREAEKPQVTQLEAIILLARRGRKEVLPQLRKLLDENPDLWKSYGDLGQHAEAAWIAMIAGPDLLLQESLVRHIRETKERLCQEHSSPLEQLLVQRVILSQLQSLWCDTIEAERLAGQDSRMAEFQLRRAEQAHRQYLSASKTLAMVRKLLPATVNVQIVHPPLDTSEMRAEASVGRANGGPTEADGKMAVAPKRSGPKRAKPLNGKRFEGCNRVSGILDQLASCKG